MRMTDKTESVRVKKVLNILQDGVGVGVFNADFVKTNLLPSLIVTAEAP